ncbi:hypothetical protein NP493_464g01048 [Ridgeia piscesae]|uniref:Uncharacterized protein n=1 Tax=Ridgeia piscesae TaxID=27915 RepID=A0AAD9NTD2_RIDPI|nr:hypothetical protein NP493_464g01048 [Ridgeia piscesae]
MRSPSCRMSVFRSRSVDVPELPLFDLRPSSQRTISLSPCSLACVSSDTKWSAHQLSVERRERTRSCISSSLTMNFDTMPRTGVENLPGQSWAM